MFQHVFATPLCGLLCCLVLGGCQTSGSSPALFGSKVPAQQVSQSNSKAAGLPEPTNKAASNEPLSLTSIEEAMQRGEQELERGNYQLAQTHFDEVLEKHPDHSRAHHRLGVLADKLNQFEQAEQHYLTALNGDPDNAALLSDLGYSYFMQGRYADGEHYLLKARKADPDYHTAVANLGLLYASTDRPQEAVAMFRKIGDEDQVDAIMKQVADGHFAPKPSPKDNPFAKSPARVAANEPAAQPETEFPAQEMSQAARDFLEQMRQAREVPNPTQPQYARQQPRGTMPTQAVPQPQVAQTQSQPDWTGQQSPSPAAAQPPAYQPNPGNLPQQGAAGPQNGALSGSALAGMMASHDGRNRSGPANNPIVFGRPEAAGTSPDGQLEQASWSSQAGGTTSSVAANAGSTLPPMQVVPNLRSGAVASSNSPQTPAAQVPAQQPQNNGSYWNQQVAAQPDAMPAEGSFLQTNGAPATANPAPGWEQQMTISPGPPATTPLPPGSAAWQTEPSQPGMIQQLGGSTGPPSHQSVEQAHHTQANGQPSNIALAGQTSPPQAVTSPADAGGNLYEQSRREAALLGMSAGPGQVFPYIRPSQPPAPATHWQSNPSPSPAPHRSPPNGPSSTAFYPGNQAPAQHAVHPQQPQPCFQRQPTANANQQAAAQPYDPTWGQAPSSAPYGVTPPSSSSQQSPANSFTPPPTNVAPTPYYQQSGASSTGQTQQAGYQQAAPYGVAPDASPGGAVQPEPYRRAIPPNTASQTMPVIQGRPTTAGPTGTPSYAQPMIVPNQRPGGMP